MGLLSVDINAPKKSNFNRSLKKRTTMAPGILYPVLFETCVPGDEIKMDIKSLVKTNALIAPLMGTFKLQFDYFFCPWRLYVPQFRINSIGNISTNSRLGFDSIDLPTFYWPSVWTDPNFDAETNNGVSFNPKGWFYSDDNSYVPWSWTVPPGSLWDYIGLPVGYNNANREVEMYSLLPFMSYVDIFRNYYMNTQEEFCIWHGCKHIDFDKSVMPTFVLDNIIAGISSYSNGSVNPFGYATIMQYPQSSSQSNRGTHLGFLAPGNGTNHNFNFNGLFSRTHRPDLYSSLLNQAYVNALNTSTRINVSNNQVTTDQIRTSFKFYKSKAISILTGGRFDEWIRGQFGVKTDLDSLIPELLGTTSTMIEFEDVVSQSATADDPLGTLAGRGVGYLDGRQHYFRPQEYGTLVVIASIQPMVDYYQGISPWLKDINMDDIFLPALDCLGFEDVPRAEMSAFIDTNPSGLVDLSVSQATADIWGKSYGKRPSWLKYHTNVNRLHGDFADSLRYWTLGRQFSSRVGADESVPYNSLTFDPTSYIDPEEFNYIFADPAKENFFVQMSFNMLWKRPISKRLMPTL